MKLIIWDKFQLYIFLKHTKHKLLSLGNLMINKQSNTSMYIYLKQKCIFSMIDLIDQVFVHGFSSATKKANKWELFSSNERK